MKLNTRTFLRITCFRVPKNKDSPSNSKMILIQPNENWNDFKTRTLKCLRYCQNTDQNPTENIWNDSCSQKLLIQPEQTWANLRESVGENPNILLIMLIQIHLKQILLSLQNIIEQVRLFNINTWLLSIYFLETLDSLIEQKQNTFVCKNVVDGS